MHVLPMAPGRPIMLEAKGAEQTFEITEADVALAVEQVLEKFGSLDHNRLVLNLQGKPSINHIKRDKPEDNGTYQQVNIKMIIFSMTWHLFVSPLLPITYLPIFRCVFP
jgi:hypothetical protein